MSDAEAIARLANLLNQRHRQVEIEGIQRRTNRTTGRRNTDG